MAGEPNPAGTQTSPSVETDGKKPEYDVALVSLDLALLYAAERRTADLKRLAVEMILIFESREVYREAMAALLLLQGASRASLSSSSP